MSDASLALLAFASLLAISGLVARAWLRRSRVALRLQDGFAEETWPARAGGESLGGVGVRVGIAVGAAIGLAVVLGSGRLSIAAGLGGIAGALAFIAYRTAADRAALSLEEALADALGLVTSALRAGASPLEALQRAARDSREPLRGLLTDLAGRLAAGEPPSDAADRLLEEAPLESFRLLALCLAVQWNAGGQLSRSLAVVSRSVRDRADVLRRIETQAAPTRGSVFLLIAANVAIVAIAWANDSTGITRFLDSDIGTALVSGTLLVQGLSLIWMWRLSRILL